MADFNIPQLRNRRLSSLLADPSVMDNYQPTQPLSGLLDYSDPAVKAGPDAIGPPTIAGGLLSLDPTDYIGPQTLGKLAAGLKGLLAGGASMPLLAGMTSQRLKHYSPPLNIFSNPTRGEAKELLSKTKAGSLRAIKDPDTGNLYMWDAYRATHEPIAYELGLDHDKLFDIQGKAGAGLSMFDNASAIDGFPFRIFAGEGK